MEKFTFQHEELGEFKIDYISEDFTYEDLKRVIYEVNTFEETGNYNRAGFESIGSGQSSIVFGYKNYAVKVLNGQKKFGLDIFGEHRDNDVEVLKTLKHTSYVPDIKAVINNNVMVMEKINGITIRDFFEMEEYYRATEKYNIDMSFAEEWDKMILDIIANGYLPHDLHDNNVMIRKGINKPVIVDTGWFKKHNKDYRLNDENDFTKLKGSEEYDVANRWVGRTIKKYAYGLT